MNQLPTQPLYYTAEELPGLFAYADELDLADRLEFMRFVLGAPHNRHLLFHEIAIRWITANKEIFALSTP